MQVIHFCLQNNFILECELSTPDLSHPSIGSSELDNRIIVNMSLPNSLIPVALVLPETSMNSFSFRGGFYEISNESYDDLAPYGFERSTHLRQSPESRDWLVSSFFNDDDKSYISGKDLWALSADAEMKALYSELSTTFICPPIQP